MVLFITLILGFLVVVLAPKSVFAKCEQEYGGGETCIYNKSFNIDKQVRLEGDDDWEDKVTGVEEGDEIEFRIRVKNTGEITVDDMKMKDSLPDGLKKISGDLTEEWDDFEPGETKTFRITVEVEDEEFDRDSPFSDCYVNEARVYFDGEEEGKAEAAVCITGDEITELPETGADATLLMTIAGLSSLGLGIVLKKESFLA